MNLHASRARLLALTRDLAVRWQETSATWTDLRRQEFEKRHLEGLFLAVDKAAAAMERLEETIRQARKDCE